MEFGPAGYVAIFAASSVLSLMLTPLAMRAAHRLGALDHPGGHKSHEEPVPYLGGLAIAASFSAAVLVLAALSPPPSGLQELSILLLLALGLAVVGLVDDLRGVGPTVRFAAETGAASALWIAGVRIEVAAPEVLGLTLTVLWIVGVTNAFNLLDNMDGLSSGVAAIGAGWFAVLAGTNGQFLVAGLAAALAGCALGFLRHNFHPARVYMGDAGSLFLGFLLSYVAIKLRFVDAAQFTALLVPVLVLGVAIFDTTLVTASRLWHHLSPFQGGKDHVSHRLVKVGLPVPAAVALIYAAGVALGWIAVVVSRIDPVSAGLLALLVATLGLFLGVLLARVPVYPSSTHRRWVLQPVEVAEPEAPSRQPDVSSATDSPRLAEQDHEPAEGSSPEDNDPPHEVL